MWTQSCTHTGRFPVNMEAKPRNAQDCQLPPPQWLRGRKGFCPRAFGRSLALPTPWFRTSSLHSCGRISICYFKLPRLWCLVLAALANDPDGNEDDGEALSMATADKQRGGDVSVDVSTETSTEHRVGPSQHGTPTVGVRTMGSDLSDIRKNEAWHRKWVRKVMITIKRVLLLGFVGYDLLFQELRLRASTSESTMATEWSAVAVGFRPASARLPSPPVLHYNFQFSLVRAWHYGQMGLGPVLQAQPCTSYSSP